MPDEKTMPDMPKTVFHEKQPTLAKPPKPLKPKGFQKVPNTIKRPMRVKNVPFKPIGVNEPRPKKTTSPNKRKPNFPDDASDESPPKKVSPQRIKPFIEDPPSQDEQPQDFWEPVRKPEKNQIAIQQLTLADSERYERVILGDVDIMTQQLLIALKNEGKIQAYRLQGTREAPEAEVILNGGLVNMAKFTRIQKKNNEEHGLGRVTNQILKEQNQR